MADERKFAPNTSLRGNCCTKHINKNYFAAFLIFHSEKSPLEFVFGFAVYYKVGSRESEL
jgi:hypothetical protein